MKLRGGFTTEDPRLDRLPEQDPRSRRFPVSAIVPEALRSRTWPIRGLWLDQGREGACVGYAWHHEAAASPVPVRTVTNEDAFARYRRMQEVDEWPGSDYSGTSVLAGAKVMQGDGFFSEYRWAFSVDDLLRAVAHEGPAVIGIPWLNSMYSTRPSGLLDCSGTLVGGHAILVRGVTLKARLKGETRLGPVVRLRNSWGEDWGKGGDAYLRVEDLEKLLAQGGDACVPVGRSRP